MSPKDYAGNAAILHVMDGIDSRSFYRHDYQSDHERIVRGRFGPDKFAWSASTLCALIPVLAPG